MSYRRTYGSIGEDAPKTSIFNLVGMDKFIKVEKTAGELLPTWLVIGAIGVAALSGLVFVARKKRKAVKP